MIVNIYQRQTEFETETGLLYFPDYNEEDPRATLPELLSGISSSKM
jgi:hypothetical protein